MGPNSKFAVFWPFVSWTCFSFTSGTGSNTGTSSQNSGTEGLEQIRYSLIVISTAPVLIAYGIVQKYFKGGVMVGSVKG